MRLTVPFLYHSKGVRPGRRRPETVMLLGRETFDVPELAGDEAPIVVVLDGYMRRDDGVRGRIEYRHVGGGFSWQAEIVGDRYDRRELACAKLVAPDVQRNLDRWADINLENGGLPNIYRHPPLASDTAAVRGYLTDERDWQWREVVEDGRAAALESLRVDMARAAFVDGALWSATPGPAWFPMMTYPEDAAPVVAIAVVADPTTWRPHMRQLCVPIDRWDDALDAARRLAAQARRGVDETRPPGVAVTRPDLLAPDLSAALREAVELTLKEMAPKLARMPSETIRLWVEARDALAALGGARLDGERYDDMLAMADHLDAAWTTYNDGRVPMGPRNPMAVFARKAAAARGVPIEHAGAVELGAEELRGLGLMK
jgi:hypothetical protein